MEKLICLRYNSSSENYASSTDFSHLARAEFFKCFLDFRSTVHYKRALTDDRFVNGFPVHHQQLGVSLRFYGDAVTVAGENGQIAFDSFTLAIHRDCATQDEERGGVAVGQRQFC